MTYRHHEPDLSEADRAAWATARRTARRVILLCILAACALTAAMANGAI